MINILSSVETHWMCFTKAWMTMFISSHTIFGNLIIIFKHNEHINFILQCMVAGTMGGCLDGFGWRSSSDNALIHTVIYWVIFNHVSIVQELLSLDSERESGCPSALIQTLTFQFPLIGYLMVRSNSFEGSKSCYIQPTALVLSPFSTKSALVLYFFKNGHSSYNFNYFWYCFPLLLLQSC